MRKILLISLLTIPFFHTASAQALQFPDGSGRLEVGLTGGGILYQGDLVPQEDAHKLGTLKDLKGFVGVLGRYKITPGLSVRAILSIGKIDGDDRRFPEPSWRQRRAFSFTSPLQEFSLMAEYDFLGGLRARQNVPLGVYVFAGLGVVRTNPDRDFSRIDAAYFGPNDPATAGIAADMADKGGRSSLVLPVGFGLRFDPARSFAIFAEGGFRKCFNDRLDGFENSVSSSDADTYTMYSAGILIKLPLPKKPNPYAI